MKKEIRLENMKFQKLLDESKNGIRYTDNNKENNTLEVEQDIIRHLAQLTVWRLNNEK